MFQNLQNQRLPALLFQAKEPEEPAPSRHRESGSRAAPTARDDPNMNLPSGVKAHFGFPQNASAFVQLRLPGGMTWDGKASRAMSFRNPDAPIVSGGTTRTLEVAKASLESWAWQWFESLPVAKQKSLRESHEPEVSERPLKKLRT